MYKYHDIRPFESDFNRLQDFVTRNAGIMFSVSEKIHGANFQFKITGGDVTVFSREQEITDLDSFYNSGDYVRGIIPKIINLEKIVRIKYGDVLTENTVVLVYGELAGRQPNGKNIQSGIEYGEMCFYAFDIVLVDDNGEGEVSKRYLTDIAKNIICQLANVEHAPPLGMYTFEQLVNTGVPVFQSTIAGPDAGVVDEVSEIRNLAEGVIVKACYGVHDVWSLNKLVYPNGRRVIAKWKTPKWSEKKNRPPRVIKQMSEGDSVIFNEILEYLHENRLANVLSKRPTSDLKPNDFGPILGEFVQDAVKDYCLDKGVTALSEIDIDDRKLLMRSVGGEATSIIRPVWLGLIDND